MKLNPAFWVKALRVIPRLERDEWDKLDIISKWLVLTRSAIFVITFIPSAIAGIYAYMDGKFNLLNWILLTLGLIFAHATNNMLNDFTDHIKGVDRENYFRARYGPHVLEHGFISNKGFFVYVVITGLIALSVAIYFIWLRGWPAFWLVLAGSFFVLFYTYPLKYIGLGEPSVLVVWGPLMIWGGYYAITGEWNPKVLIASFIYGLGPTGILFGKHIDKIEEDKKKGIRTLPVILGEIWAKRINLVIMFLPYVLVVYLVIVGFFKPTMLITLLGLYWYFSRFWKVYTSEKPTEPPPYYPKEAWPLWYVAFAFDQNKKFGYLFLLGLILEVILRALHR